ncbi:aldo/keto reductase [Paenibacillus aestuarii]|uniref:Aldo/keto reductase n=1 Tax=Paenibacillus aestuarii TaxID=516965 RepID=A0ABW0KCX8_9BACL
MGGLGNHLRKSRYRSVSTDYVDLYQIHRWDYDTPIEERMEALHDVVKAGCVGPGACRAAGSAASR